MNVRTCRPNLMNCAWRSWRSRDKISRFKVKKYIFRSNIWRRSGIIRQKLKTWRRRSNFSGKVLGIRWKRSALLMRRMIDWREKLPGLRSREVKTNWNCKMSRSSWLSKRDLLRKCKEGLRSVEEKLRGSMQNARKNQRNWTKSTINSRKIKRNWKRKNNLMSSLRKNYLLLPNNDSRYIFCYLSGKSKLKQMKQSLIHWKMSTLFTKIKELPRSWSVFLCRNKTEENRKITWKRGQIARRSCWRMDN